MAPNRADFAQSVATLSAYEFSTQATRLTVAIGARPAPCVSVKADRLAENMVVVENLFNEASLLIVAAGTRFSSSAADRIARHLPNCTVRVTSANG